MGKKTTQTEPERGITPLYRWGVLDSRNVHNEQERNAFLIFRASEIFATVNVPEGKYDEKEYRKAKRFYEDYKRILQKKGLSNDVCEACDRFISDLETFAGIK